MKIGDKVKVNKDIPSINGMLREGTMVRIDYISSDALVATQISHPNNKNLRVTDDLGKIWYLNKEDINV